MSSENSSPHVKHCFTKFNCPDHIVLLDNYIHTVGHWPSSHQASELVFANSKLSLETLEEMHSDARSALTFMSTSPETHVYDMCEQGFCLTLRMYQ